MNSWDSSVHRSLKSTVLTVSVRVSLLWSSQPWPIGEYLLCLDRPDEWHGSHKCPAMSVPVTVTHLLCKVVPAHAETAGASQEPSRLKRDSREEFRYINTKYQKWFGIPFAWGSGDRWALVH